MNSVKTEVTKLSHKAFRALLKKFRRKKKRQNLAKTREHEEFLEQQQRENSPNYQEREAEKRRCAALWDEFQEKERIRKHKDWLLRQERAEAEFKRKKILQELEWERKEEERKKMLLELENQQLVKVKNTALKNKKEETLQAALSGLPKGNEPWHNPIAPPDYNKPFVEREQCIFFAKTGCCRFGERCSRGHYHPSVSTTLLLRGMYNHFSIEQSHRDDYDTDMALEFEDTETYQDFKRFYEDVLPEFKKCGPVTQFKVCCNHEPHLRGNVYIQFSREEYAVEAFKKFNGRFYASKQLSCEFTNVTNWKSAICGLFVSKRCPKGNNCNFLHVFQNPEKEFWPADRNLPEHLRQRFSDRQRAELDRKSSRRSKRYSSDSSDSTLKNSENGGDSTYSRRRKKSKNRRNRSRTPPANNSDRKHHKKSMKSKKKKRKRHSSISD